MFTAQVADLASTSVTVLSIGPSRVLRPEIGTEESMLCPRGWTSLTSSSVKTLVEMPCWGVKEVLLAHPSRCLAWRVVRV